jgi:cytochrome c peroxidase
MSRTQRLGSGSTPLVLVTLLIAACGGGGGGGSDHDDNGTSPPPPVENHAPVVASANADQRAVVLHPFSYDASQAGTTFSDPDGDALRYEIDVVGPLTAGLRIDGTRIVGTPEEAEVITVRITAFDPDDDAVDNEFRIRIDPNSDPVVTKENDDRLVTVGNEVSLDANQGGAVFTDPDGDPLSFEVTLRGLALGLSVDDTRVVGAMSAVGLVEVTINARDGFGGSASDVFTIAAPAPEPGRPTLPTIPYVYDDAKLDLPFLFRISSEDQIPLWDTQPPDNRTTDAGAALGRVLFYDKRLSNTNTVACSTCHLQSHGFSTPERFSVGALGIPLKRHVMALANTRYNIHSAWFSDMRVRSLQELALQPIDNPEEVGGTVAMLPTKLSATDFYASLFEAAFGSPEITQERIARAIAQFLQSLISYRAKFDAAYNPEFNGPGDPESVLTEQELRGAAIFKDPVVSRCEVCHQPNIHTNEWQANNGIDAVPTDPGTTVPAFQRDGSVGVFRAASLRNVAVTAPYMHDGRFASLREVIDHYDHGIQDNPNLDGALRDLSTGGPRPMNLSEEDKLALEAFLNTLTDHAFLTDPKFSDPFAP